MSYDGPLPAYLIRMRTVLTKSNRSIELSFLCQVLRPRCDKSARKRSHGTCVLIDNDGQLPFLLQYFPSLVSLTESQDGCLFRGMTGQALRKIQLHTYASSLTQITNARLKANDSYVVYLPEELILVRSLMHLDVSPAADLAKDDDVEIALLKIPLPKT
ncbi:uncharacterized protein BDR25DRAFT_356333 [Lindgomyces ingoldianus]|uniref:Uncharacterized protein n=1 Tax=Lindgomyces ingoldianus TaxID=673940 RepID=A0ACB6QRJ4_9PLEO|nr:uncharacterized protein BDR25DRAFT_356333 [Lindgomyces ingoldianus]KAF2469603.1 hypothetical protein BDR25DRAFT_356333 [Lindgomyces ingoldianus]